MEHYQMLKDLAVVIVSAAVAMRVFNMLHLPLLLGFILTGILLYPVFGVVDGKEAISELGELGVSFMMFFIGLEFNLERLKSVFLPSFFGIIFQIFAMGALGIYAASAMGLGGMNGIFLGGVLAMSSTVVIVEMFTRRKDLDKYYAQVATGILILEDFFAIFLLVALSDMADNGVRIAELGSTTLAMFSFVVAIFVAGKLTVPALLNKAAEREDEMVMFTFCLILGIGELAVASGLSLALGAFLAGAIISGTEISNKIERMSAPFRNLFVAVFFISTGMLIEPSSLFELWKPILWLSLGVVVIQTLACFTGALIGGAPCADAFKASVSKAQIGEFSFVIAALGVSLGVMDQAIMTVALGVSFVTVFANPILYALVPRVSAAFARVEPRFLQNFFEWYSGFLSKLSASAARSRTFALVLGAVVACAVYLLLINALYVVSCFLISNFAGEGVWPKFIISAAAAALALPLIFGILRNLGLGKLTFGKFGAGLETRFIVAVRRHLDNADFKRRDILISDVKSRCSWATEFAEVEIGELSAAAGKSVGELSIRSRTGAEIAAVRRGRFADCEINAPYRIYPEDVVILAGSSGQIASAVRILSQAGHSHAESSSSPITAESIVVEKGMWLAGMKISEAQLPKKFGVRILAVRSDNSERRPIAEDTISEGYELLLMGTSENVGLLKKSLGIVS